MVSSQIEIPKTSSPQTCLLALDWPLFVPICTETLVLPAQNPSYYPTTLVLFTFYLKMYGSSRNLWDNQYGTPCRIVIFIVISSVNLLVSTNLQINIQILGLMLKQKGYFFPLSYQISMAKWLKGLSGNQGSAGSSPAQDFFKNVLIILKIRMPIQIIGKLRLQNNVHQLPSTNLNCSFQIGHQDRSGFKCLESRLKYFLRCC